MNYRFLSIKQRKSKEQKVDQVNVFLLLITFSHRLEILWCPNINVDEQFQQMTVLMGEDTRIVETFVWEDESITLTNLLINKYLFVYVKAIIDHKSRQRQNISDGSLI